MTLIFFGFAILVYLYGNDDPNLRFLVGYVAVGMITFGVEYLFNCERLRKAATAPETPGAISGHKDG